MKRIILTLLALVPLLAFGQVKGKTFPKSTKTNVEKLNKPNKPTPIVNVEESVKNNAEKWFRESYVDKLFKDPYSYKLLKLTSERISVKQSLTDSLNYLDEEIAKCKIGEKERTMEARNLWQIDYDKIKLDIKKNENSLNEEKDTKLIEYWNKRLAISKKYALDILTALKEYDIYFLTVGEKKRIQEKLLIITPEQQDAFAFYKIKIDCYSKNSIGNEVLGRFQFPFTQNGHIGSGEGHTTVVQLNKVD